MTMKNRYRERFDLIVPSEELLDATRTSVRMATAEESTHSSRRAWSWHIIAAASVLALLIGAVPVLATSSETVNDALYEVSPELALKLRSVHQSSESNGIRMEVISCTVEGSQAVMLISMTDLESSRIDETTDLYDSYQLRTGRDQIGYCERVGYHPDTGSCLFRITVQTMDGSPIASDQKISFSVREFLSGGTCALGVKVPVTLQDLPALDVEEAEEGSWVSDSVMPVPLDRSASYSIIKSVSESGVVLSVETMHCFEILGGSFPENAPSYALLMLPEEPGLTVAENCSVTGAAVINGILHVQMRFDQKREMNTHGVLYLKTADDTVIRSQESYSFRYRNVTSQETDGSSVSMTLSATTGVDHIEYLFDLSLVDLSVCELYGDFYTNMRNTHGNWSVTLPVGGVD